MTYEVFVKKYIHNNEAVLGSELSEALEKKYDITRATARKRISRLVKSKEIESTNPVTFGSRQYGYYLDKLTGSKIKKLSVGRPPLKRIIQGLDENGGVLSYYDALKISATPLDTSKTKRSDFWKIISDLKTLNVIHEIKDYKGIRFLISTSKDPTDSVLSVHYNKMKLDVIFIRDILKWLKRTNMAENFEEFRSRKVLSKGARKNNFVWDAFGYNCATGFNTVYESNKESKDKKAVIVLDVKMRSAYTATDLEGFYERVQGVLCSSKKRKYKLIPVIVSKEMTTEAKAKVMNLGFIHYELGVIYGENVYRVLDNYFELTQAFLEKDELKQSNKNNVSINEMLESSLSELKNSGQDSNLMNIKGDLFELAIFQFLRETLIGFNIEHSAFVNKAYEYDFIARNYATQECIVKCTHRVGHIF